jgi:hypothetical protein
LEQQRSFELHPGRMFCCGTNQVANLECNSITAAKLIGTAHRSKLIDVLPILPQLCIGMFIACLSIAILLFLNSGFSIGSSFTIGWSLSSAAIISYLSGMLFKKGAIARQDCSKVKDIVRRKRGCPEYKLFISNIAKEITQKMPVAIIMEDSGNLDEVTADVVDHIVSPGTMTSIGVILWVVFHGHSHDSGYAILQKSGIPSKHFLMCRSAL